MGHVFVRLLNGFAFTVGGELVPLALSAKRLVAFLALNQGLLERRHVASSLWFGNREKSEACLRSAIWRLGRERTQLVQSSRREIGLARDVCVDVREQARVAAELMASAWTPDARQFDVLILDLLPGWQDDWVQLERARLRQLRLHALESAAGRLMDERAFGAAIAAAFAALQIDPLRESAHRLLVRAHAREGNQVEAMRCYSAYRELVTSRVGAGSPARGYADIVR